MSSEAASKSVLEALYERYDDTVPEGDQNNDFVQIFVPVKAAARLASGGFHLPESVGLECLGVTHCGDSDKLSSLCADIKELDLLGNSVTNWTEVFTLLDAIPTLEMLNLSKNPLVQLTDVEEGRFHPRLKKLVLNYTNLTWESVAKILAIVPNLEELYLSGNSYEAVMLDIPAYESLRLLQFTDNGLSEWKHVVKLHKLFPRLKNLILANNKISSCGDMEENASMYASLSILNMNSTAISDWDELDKLSAIKSIEDIKLASIPLVKGITNRTKLLQLFSVHFPRLKLVNGSSIPKSDLVNAEMVYLRHFEDCSIKPNKYAELEAKHGKLQQLAQVDMTPPFSVSLVVVCDDKQEEWDVPTKQTVGQLKRALKSFVGTSKFELFIEKHIGIGPWLLPTHYNNRFIHTLRLQGGERLLCHKFNRE